VGVFGRGLNTNRHVRGRMSGARVWRVQGPVSRNLPPQPGFSLHGKAVEMAEGLEKRRKDKKRRHGEEKLQTRGSSVRRIQGERSQPHFPKEEGSRETPEHLRYPLLSWVLAELLISVWSGSLWTAHLPFVDSLLKPINSTNPVSQSTLTHSLPYLVLV
jgi:hypothetical protein